MKKMRNLSKIRIKGLNQERAISKICKERKIYNLNRIEKSVSEFEVKVCDLKKVKGQLVSEGFEVEVLSSHGVSVIFKKFLSCYGILIGLFLVVLFYILQFGLIWQVKIYGTEKLDSEVIQEYIDENFSKFKKNISTEDIEISLKENFKRISAVSVSVVGQSLVVNIHETFYPVEMEGDFSPIYAEEDCKIIDITLVQGTLAVDEGDVVRKGDVLVYPYVIDSQGQQREVKAEARIKAEVWLIGESEHSEGYYKTYRTGKSLETHEIKLFGLNIYTKTKECEFASFELEESHVYLSKFNILPLVLDKKVYYETKTEFVEKSFEEVKDEKIQEAKQKALISFKEYDIIKNEVVNVNSGAGLHNISYIITVEREVGVDYEDLYQEGGARV